MSDLTHYRIGYCTNVHAGRDFDSVCQNVQEYCIPIRKLVEPDGKIGVGLWFSEQSAAESLRSGRLQSLKEMLEIGGVVPFTLNGFPQGDFHSRVVKHLVYQPEWWTRERLEYTLNLVEILDRLLPDGEVGSISTLPISWGRLPINSNGEVGDAKATQDLHAKLIQRAADHLLELANHLHRRFETTGRRIVIAIEPEPGCYLTDSKSFRDFFTKFLSAPAIEESQAQIARSHLTLCHDICHAAVMFEDQEKELGLLRKEGISIGKVQVSSAIQVIWDSLDSNHQSEAIQQLKGFAEDRYLHQTHVCESKKDKRELHEDLPAVLRAIPTRRVSGEWRIHFHVPIYLEAFGRLHSTQLEIFKFLSLLRNGDRQLPEFTGHLEIETYAWSVLPKPLQAVTLQDGIADELMWFRANLG